MELYIRSVKVLQPESAFNGQRVNIHIQNGIISSIEIAEAGDKHFFNGVTEINAEGLCVSPGWFDMRMRTGEPGHESRETLASVCAAGAAGGFTGMACLPELKPPVQSRESVSYLLRNTESYPCRLLPLAAVTLNLEGKLLTEMLDLHNAGAIAFTDGTRPLHNPDILYKTLQYLQHIKGGGLLMQRAEDPSLAKFGLMHEGHTSTLMGLKGIPSLAEELMILRDLKLLAHAGGRLHFSTLSSKEGVEAVRAAKKAGLNVTADVAVHQLLFTDEDVSGFDTFLKAEPPFRSEADRLALLEGLADGTIDAIVSDHTPLDTESKLLEFDRAEPGLAALETFYPIALAQTKGYLSETELIDKISAAPRRILGLPQPVIAPGQTAELTFFSPEIPFTYKKEARKTLAINSPFFGKEWKGKVLFTLRGTHGTYKQ